MRKLFAFIALVGVVYALALQHGVVQRMGGSPGAAAETEAASGPSPCDPTRLSAAYRDHLSRIEVCGSGTVAKVLREDTEGSRHQRFLVRLPSGQTLLVAYNLDLAPRIEGLRPGSPIEFMGEYEWNRQGGVLHWTHHDPAGHHASGWIRYGGRQYQ
jgi:hypothetical protein